MIKSAAQSTIANTQKYRNMNGSYVASSDYKLDEVVLTGSVASVTFDLSSYVGAYKNLQIRYLARTSRSEINDSLGIRINGDTGAKYTAHYLYGNGSSALSGGYGSATYALNLPLAGNTTASGVFAGGVIDILDAFSSTKNKTLRGLGGLASSFNQIMLCSGFYNDLATSTSVTLITLNGANLITGSRFTLYGSN